MRHLPRIIIDAVLFCPHCGARHVDESRNGEKWHRRAHTTHRCQSCGGDFDVYVSGQAPDAAADECACGDAKHIDGGCLCGAKPPTQNP